MNTYEKHASFLLLQESFSQRNLAKLMNCSLGTVNKTLGSLISEQWIQDDFTPSQILLQLVHENHPKNAIILAAGFGLRSVPINITTPKPLIEVNGERVIERQIRMLHGVGITNISIVVGFMKERFEYLIDRYNVKLIINEDYKQHNNIASLLLVSDALQRTYIIPGDVWLEKNPFSRNDFYSWYLISNKIDPSSKIRVGRNGAFARVNRDEFGQQMIGIAYLTKENSNVLASLLNATSQNKERLNSYWEEMLLGREWLFGKFAPRIVSDKSVVDINTYEDLRMIDDSSNQLNTQAIDAIIRTLNVDATAINHIAPLKKGMTNRSFSFVANDTKYIMRIPGEGTEQLINRSNEAKIYSLIRDFPYIEKVDYINPENGYKISEFIEGSISCDASDRNQVRKCMKVLRELHSLQINSGVRFELFDHLEFYESLWGRQPSIFEDYAAVKNQVYQLRSYVEKNKNSDVICHIDANADNFIFSEDGRQSSIHLIDWEYAGQQDPLVDVAMFAIYAGYSKEQIDWVLGAYLNRQPKLREQILLYSYVSICGLLWSNWCQYKQNLGVEFGEYFMQQYRYAKEYSKDALALIARGGEQK